MKRKVSKLLLLITLMLPLCLEAKIVNYEDSIKYANEYIKDFKNFNDYLKINMPYNYEIDENLYNNKFRNGGFLSKDEFKITNAYDNSYLATGIEYWTLSRANNFDMHTIDYRLTQRKESEKTDIRVTEFVKNETKVTGSGTKNNPWVFIDTYNVNLISTNKERGTLSLSKCNNISEGKETLTVPMYEGYKSVFYVCEDIYYRYYNSTCDNYFTGEINSNKYYISPNIGDNTICRLNFTYRVNEVELQDCTNCTAPSPKQFYIAQNKEKYFKDYNAQKELTKLETVPSKTGYTFKGYYRSGSFVTENLIIKEDGTFNSKDLSDDKTTLIPKMEANTYTVTLKQDKATTKGTTSVTATFDSSMPGITTPQRKHKVTYNANGGTITKTLEEVTYSFVGYYIDDKQYYDGDGNSKNNWDVASDSTLVEKWTTSGAILPGGTRANYTFEGWYTAASGGTKVGTTNDNYKPDGDITLYAQWKIIDGVAPECSLAISSDGKKINATYSDNTGGSGIAYYGWDSSYSGTKSAEKDATNGEHTFYVSDNAGNKKTCKVDLDNTTDEVITIPGTCDGAAITYANQNKCNYRGGCNYYDGVYNCTYNTKTNKCDCIINAFRTAGGGHECCNCYGDYFYGSWNESVQKYQCKRSYAPTTKATTGCQTDEYVYKSGWCAKYW